MADKNEILRDVVIKREFNARRDLVFKAWTDPKYVAQWWGPNGFTNPVCELDVREGGAIRIHMRDPQGTIYPMAGFFGEIVKPERLVFTSIPLDEKGEPLFKVLNTVTFVEKDGKTLVAVHAHVLTAVTGAEVYLSGMEEGWSQTLGRLEAFVKENLA